MANKKSPPVKTSSWDLEAFEQQVSGDSNWSQNSDKKKKAKKVTRVQDLGFSLDTPPSSPPGSNSEKKEEEKGSTWPFESSPCRMFGGKNTRNHSSDDTDSRNEKLFDTKFADRSSSKKFDSDDEETSIEDDLASEIFVDDSDDSESFYGGEGDRSASTLDAASFSRQPQQPQRNSAAAIATRTADDDSHRKKEKGSSDSVSTRSKSSSPRRAGRMEQHKQSRSSRSVKSSSSSLSKQRKPEKQTKPAAGSSNNSANGKHSSGNTGAAAAGRKKADKPRSRSNDESMMSATYHGSSGPAPQPPERSTRARRGVSRAKSSDGMEGMGGPMQWQRNRGSKRDDALGGGSYHTSASTRHGGARASSRQRDRGPKSSALDRRGKLSRAMSNTNVKRPEEYAHNEANNHDDKGNRVGKPPKRATSVANLGSSTATSSSTREKRSSSRTGQEEASASAEDAATATTATTSDDSSAKRPAMRRKKSGRLGRSGSNRSIASNASQPHGGRSSEDDAKSPGANKSLPGGSSSGGSGAGTPKAAANNGTTTRRSTSSTRPDRRDLAVLLKERKTIQPADLMDKENRKLLHFLMYEHKMGISQKELYRRIRQEKESS